MKPLNEDTEEVSTTSSLSFSFAASREKGVIEPALAKRLIKDFRDRNEAPGNSCPIRRARSADDVQTNPEGKHLRGFYIAADDFKTILKDPEVKGISFYFAKSHHATEADSGQPVSLIFRAAKDKTGFDGEIENYGDYFNYIEPCPDKCGDEPE